MKPLENRAWFGLLSLAIAFALMSLLWIASGLPATTSAATPFLFATLGLTQGVSKLLALALIKYDGRLEDVG